MDGPMPAFENKRVKMYLEKRIKKQGRRGLMLAEIYTSKINV